MTRGEIWLAQVGRKRRPVLVLTRPEVIDVRERITVAEITTVVRGLATEVPVEGLSRPSAINCDGLHTVPRSMLTKHIGAVDQDTLDKVCWAAQYAIGC